MGIYFCKRPEVDRGPVISYELFRDSLTKWCGEPAYQGHVFYLDNLSTSYYSEVIQWKVMAILLKGHKYVEVVYKTFPRYTSRGLSFRSGVFFKNEIDFYENILPELQKFYNSRVTEPFNNHLRVFLSVLDKNYDCIVFHNEIIQGFMKVKDKLDIEHAKLVLRTIAKFHAISFAMKDQNGEEFKRLCNGVSETYFNNSYWNWYKRLWGEICAVAIDAVEEEYANTKYVELIKKFAVPSRFKDMIEAVNDRNNCVITHGDCSTSNYIFKYDGETPVDVKMLDFQQTRCGSPALDICSILYNNTDLLECEEELLKYYHGELSMQVKKLGSNPDIYNWDTFKSEVKKYSYFGVAVSFENATTTLTAAEITDRVIKLGWFSDAEIMNIADVHEVKNLENKQRLDLAKNFVHCVDNGYITGALLESPMFNFW